jgi:ABC-type lipoprotein release transport system permease subunit
MIALHVRAQLRARWRSWLAWVLVVGVATGIPVAVLAGAERTQTAYDRFLDTSEAFDVLVTNGGTSPTNLNRQFDFDALARRPEVAASSLFAYYFPFGVRDDGLPISPQSVTPFALLDDHFGTTFNQLRMLEGRMPTAEDEIAVSPLAADALSAGVGDTVRMDLLSAEAAFTATLAEHQDPAGRFRVVGEVAVQAGFPPVTGGIPAPVFLARSFASANPTYAEVMAVKLAPGAVTAAFIDTLQELGAPDQVASTSRAELRAPVQRGLDAQATALRVFALLVAVIASFLVFQALRRRMALDAVDDPVWVALGATDADLRRSRVVIGLLVAPLAAVASAGTAIALSAVFPVGVGRDVESEPGVRVDGFVVALGVLVVLALVVVFLFAGAWWQSKVDRTARRPRRPAQVAPRLASSGLPVTVAFGMGMAVDGGRGTRSVPLRSTLFTLAVGIAAVAAVLVFSSSQQHLFDKPELFGWAWDLQIGDAFAGSLDDLAAELEDEPRADAVALATVDRVTIGDQTFDVLAIAADGGIEPTVVDGVPPAEDDEIMLGSRTARRLGLSIGDTLTARSGDQEAELQVVGVGVLPDFAGTAGLGEGVEVTLDGLRRLTPDLVTDAVLIDTVPGPDGQELIDELVLRSPGNSYLPSKPSDLAALARLGGLPSVVALLLTVAGLLSLIGTLVATARRRRGELATLKAVGLRRAQLGSVVLWQAATFAVLAAAVAIPTGIVAGRLLWLVFSDRLGVPYEPAVPAGWVAALALASVVLALVAAVGPAVAVARTRPGPALRAE